MKTEPRTFALIPAAGQSTRMGQPKLSLPLGGRTVLEWVIAVFQKAGIEKIVVVLAPDARELAALTQSAGAKAALLEEQTPDMRATIEYGLAWIEQHWQPALTDCWFLSPADHPTLEPEVIEQMLTAWKEVRKGDGSRWRETPFGSFGQSTRKGDGSRWRATPFGSFGQSTPVPVSDLQEFPSIFVPTYRGKRGHPALIGWNHVPAIRAIPTGQGLNVYFREQRGKTLEVPVSSEEILRDLDTPEDYQELLRRWPSVRA